MVKAIHFMSVFLQLDVVSLSCEIASLCAFTFQILCYYSNFVNPGHIDLLYINKKKMWIRIEWLFTWQGIFYIVEETTNDKGEITFVFISKTLFLYRKISKIITQRIIVSMFLIIVLRK